MSTWRKQIPSVSIPDVDKQPTSIPAALMAVQEAVQLHAREGSGVEYLRKPVRSLCVLAQQTGMPPQKLVVELKQALSVVPEVHNMAYERRDDVRKRVVALAIQSYFGVAR